MNEPNQLLFFFSALGAFNGFLLSIYFAINTKKKEFANYFLALLLLVISIRIIKSVFFYFNPQLSNIFIQIGLSACILIGPFLFLYLKSFSKEGKSNWVIHTVPFIVGITIIGIFYPYMEHRKVWSNWIVTGIYFQWLVYSILAIKYLKPIFKKIKQKEKLKNLEVWLLSIYLGVFVIWIAYKIGSYGSYIVGALSFSFVFYLILLLVIFRNNRETTFFQEKEKYKNKEIDKEMLALMHQKLAIIVEKELFLDHNFTLEVAAKELKVTKHLLSQYINDNLGKSFSSLIKEYRIEKAKQLLQTESNYTIEGLGYDSGFSSKSTFFTAFKNITGFTPAEYQKLHSK
ncbi:helix-turn-helix domain-containing protein [Chishuiella changwenlii]|uniref:helix-turn-helix domain-containing protein n=1 Tax=Chishuiella changwenlii TaxID=1434701 RepID=UPI002FDB5B3C